MLTDRNLSLVTTHQEAFRRLIHRTQSLLPSFRSREYANTASSLSNIFGPLLTSSEATPIDVSIGIDIAVTDVDDPCAPPGLRTINSVSLTITENLIDRQLGIPSLIRDLAHSAANYFRRTSDRSRWNVPEFSMLVFGVSRFRSKLDCHKVLWNGLLRVVADEILNGEDYYLDEAASQFSPQSVMNLAQAYASTYFCMEAQRGSNSSSLSHNGRTRSSLKTHWATNQNLDFFMALADRARQILAHQNAQMEKADS